MDLKYTSGVRNINVPVSDEIYDAAKVAAAKSGMFFGKWVERAIADAAEPPQAGQPVKLREPKETTYAPLED